MGDIAINWDYDLHLYFQIIRKLIGIFENYPGADSENDIPFYRKNCPDLNLLLKLDLKAHFLFIFFLRECLLLYYFIDAF